MKSSFTDTVAFFKEVKMAEAEALAQQALKFATAMDAAATAGKWDDLKAAVTGLTPLCQQCHGAYRERLEDGSYRVKSGDR
jgi:cytochrome c556